MHDKSMQEMQVNLISEHGAYKAKAAEFVKALKYQLASQDEELANVITTKDLEIASMNKQIAHQIGLETQAGIPKNKLDSNSTNNNSNLSN